MSVYDLFQKFNLTIFETTEQSGEGGKGGVSCSVDSVSDRPEKSFETTLLVVSSFELTKLIMNLNICTYTKIKLYSITIGSNDFISIHCLIRFRIIVQK